MSNNFTLPELTKKTQKLKNSKTHLHPCPDAINIPSDKLQIPFLALLVIPEVLALPPGRCTHGCTVLPAFGEYAPENLGTFIDSARLPLISILCAFVDGNDVIRAFSLCIIGPFLRGTERI